MSRDIRSYFITKGKTQEPNDTGAEPRKRNSLTFSDNDKDDGPPKSKIAKIANNKEAKADKSNSRQGKRTISSDKEEKGAVTIHAKKKRPGPSSANNKKGNSHKVLEELLEYPVELLERKPINRACATTVTSKETQGSSKEFTTDSKNRFIDEDDDLDATLNQMDTTQFEDEYFASIKTDTTSSHLKSKGNESANAQVSKEGQCNIKNETKIEKNRALITKVSNENELKEERTCNVSPRRNLESTTRTDVKLIAKKKIASRPSTLSTVSNETNISQDGINHLKSLVEKYRPREMKQIIGQTGEESNANKLNTWLKNWHDYHSKKSTTIKKPSCRDDTGTKYKAVLLSGPPGIGKTTTAHVVCAQLGYEVLELNASDTRSKKLLQEDISGIISNKTVKSLVDQTATKPRDPPKHVLLMDEVDGMAGNEDRGGMQELIALIKSTEIPIICTCNDRQGPKIRTLANYAFDLRFQKPRIEQIIGPMMSLCFKEGIKIDPKELTLIIQSTNRDIRQVINQLAVLAATSKLGNKRISVDNEMNCRDLKLGPWDVVRKVFSAEEHKSMSIHDKSDLFFHDYNTASLFVEENYLNITPSGPKNQVLDKIAKCSDSLALGDLIEKNIRSNQSWNLLPVQACFSSVIPGSVMSGCINSQMNFPSWLGKSSRTNKCDRILQDITAHARITTGASKEAINLDYIKLLVDSIVRPLALGGAKGVEEAIDVMNHYHLTRDDLDSLIELTRWPHTRDPMQSIDKNTKTAFTKACNKTAMFAGVSTMKKKAPRDKRDDEYGGESEGELSDNNEDDEKIENNKLIKFKGSKARGKEAPESKPKKTRAKVKKPAKTAARSKK